MVITVSRTLKYGRMVGGWRCHNIMFSEIWDNCIYFGAWCTCLCIYSECIDEGKAILFSFFVLLLLKFEDYWNLCTVTHFLEELYQ